MTGEFTMTTLNDDRFILLPDGRRMPAIAGGRTNEPAAPVVPPAEIPPANIVIQDVPEGIAPVITPPPTPAPRPGRRPSPPPPPTSTPLAELLPPSAAPELVPVRIGSREFTLPPDVAAAYQEREREFSRGITMDRERAQRLEALENWRQQVVNGPTLPGAQVQTPPVNTPPAPWGSAPPTPAPQQPPPDFNVLWFQDPVRAAQVVEQRATQAAEARWRAEMAERDFWDQFYRKHDIYREDDFFVKSMAGRHYNELMALPSVEARIDRLGELTGNEILRLSRKTVNGTTPTAAATPTPRPGERASGERVPEPTPEEVEEASLPKTLGEAIKQRRHNRDKAGARGGGRG